MRAVLNLHALIFQFKLYSAVKFFVAVVAVKCSPKAFVFWLPLIKPSAPSAANGTHCVKLLFVYKGIAELCNNGIFEANSTAKTA